MTTWLILNARGQRGRVEIDDITTRSDGSLVGLRRVDASKPIRLEPVFVLAHGAWRSAWVDGHHVEWEPDTAPPPGTAADLGQPRPTDTFAHSRRAVVDARLAALPDPETTP